MLTNRITAGLPAALFLMIIFAHYGILARVSLHTDQKRQVCYPHKDHLPASFSVSYQGKQAAISAKVPDRIY